MLGYYNYTVIVTYLGMICGFVGITCTQRGDCSAALICLMIAGVCDMLDGPIASTLERTQREQNFGVQIDSLSDLICFGVLPALIVYTACERNGLWLFPSTMYLLCALIRLAWFNVDEQERQRNQRSRRTEYRGLPVTTVAVILPLVMGFSKRFGWPVDRVCPMLLLLLAVAFLTPFQLKKPALSGRIGMLLCGGGGLIFLLMAGVDL